MTKCVTPAIVYAVIHIIIDPIWMVVISLGRFGKTIGVGKLEISCYNYCGQNSCDTHYCDNNNNKKKRIKKILKTVKNSKYIYIYRHIKKTLRNWKYNQSVYNHFTLQPLLNLYLSYL